MKNKNKVFKEKLILRNKKDALRDVTYFLEIGHWERFICVISEYPTNKMTAN